MTTGVGSLSHIGDVGIVAMDTVCLLELRRAPHNFFDEQLLVDLRDALVWVDSQPGFRVVVLAADGRNFCAGADLRGIAAHGLRRVYRAASGLFTTRKPIIAAIHGAAVGGGLGLAMAADLRVLGADARLSANFARLGFHHGFGLSVTLPAVVGQQRALDLLYSGRAVLAPEALSMGLGERVVDDPRSEAVEWATELAKSAPRSLTSIRSTMRRDLAARVVHALDVEATAQSELLDSHDFHEGVAASIAKRTPQFDGT